MSTAWQPIASAPMDGTSVLLTDGCFVFAGHWRGGYWDRSGTMIGTPSATHWTPMPAVEDAV